MFAYAPQQQQHNFQHRLIRPASLLIHSKENSEDRFLTALDRALLTWMESAGASSAAGAEQGSSVTQDDNNHAINNNGDVSNNSNIISESNNNANNDSNNNSQPQRQTPQTIPDYAPPPYWSHVRNPSRLSQISQLSFDGRRPAPIILEDHTEESTEQSKASWARNAHIEDHVVITGSAPGIGDYVVWNCTIDTLNGASFTIRKRYSEFDKLRNDLVKAFPQAASSLPPLPPKSLIKRFNTKFLEKRREGLMYFLNCVVLNPEFSASPILRDFLLS